jgi:hypothetical protein
VAALEPFRRRDLPPGIGRPPLPFVDIRKHVVAERRDARFRFVGQAGARPLLGAAEVARIQ